MKLRFGHKRAIDSPEHFFKNLSGLVTVFFVIFALTITESGPGDVRMIALADERAAPLVS
jgi:hypothetical protein